MQKRELHIILNPASSGGKTGEHQHKILSSIEKYFGNDYTLWITGKPNDAFLFTKKAIEEGCSLLISAGGDGTIQEIVNGLLNTGNNKHSCKLGLLNCGTGQGFAQSLCLPKNIDDQLGIIKKGFTRSIDAGKISFYLNGEKQTRYFINEFQAGIGGAVVRNVNKNLKRKGGLIAFGLGTISTVLNFPNQRISMILDDSTEIKGEYTGIVVANGNMTGGGMNLSPLSNLSDNFFNLLIIHKQKSIQRLFNFSKIYSGRHINSRTFSYMLIKKIVLMSDEDVPVEADGEIFSPLPCEIEIIPSAVEVCANNHTGESHEKVL
jgi:YegS/Rv2252/BmrU family lipid kinase